LSGGQVIDRASVNAPSASAVSADVAAFGIQPDEPARLHAGADGDHVGLTGALMLGAPDVGRLRLQVDDARARA
jgi:hypothetical protein